MRTENPPVSDSEHRYLPEIARQHTIPTVMLVENAPNFVNDGGLNQVIFVF
jgi:hypothetical protein